MNERKSQIKLSMSSPWLIVFGLAILKMAIHLFTAGNYGLFVDELYFLASGQHLVWNIQHHFPILELQANIRRSQRNVSLAPIQFLLEEILYLHPLTLPIWLVGLGWLFFHPHGKAYRVFGWAFLMTLGILLVTQGRIYYLAPAFPMLLAAGAVAIEAWFLAPRRPGAENGTWRVPPRLTWLRPIATTLLLIGGIVIAPFFLPVLPPEMYVRYSEALGMRTPKLENFQESALPQIFADRFSWPEMAQTTAQVYRGLSS